MRTFKLISAAVVCAGAASAWAADASDDWRYSGTIYLWGAGIKGDMAGGANIDVGFDTLIRNLNLAFMSAFEARKSAWSWGVDITEDFSSMFMSDTREAVLS